MKRMKEMAFGAPLGVLALAALIVGAIPGESRATRTCDRTAAYICDPINNPSETTDCDDDGFSDYVECNGITATVPAANPAMFPNGHFYGWNERATAGNDRTKHLDPAGRDHFVILALTTNSATNSSKLTDKAYLFEDVTKSATDGLNITLHFLNDFTYSEDRRVATEGPHKAIRILENTPDTTGTSNTILGLTSPNARTSDGLPTDNPPRVVTTTVFTTRLQNFTKNTGCGSNAKLCYDYYTKVGCFSSSGGATESAWSSNQAMIDSGCLENLYKAYHRQNVAHEFAHQLKMATTSNQHYTVDTKDPPTNSLMSAYVFTKKYNGGAKAKFFIPRNFLSTDVNNMTMWAP